MGMVDFMIGDRIPGSGTSAYPVYYCLTCRDSGLVFSRDVHLADYDVTLPLLIGCPACDGKPRLCGEVDEPTPALDAQRNVKHGGPA
jgi:hypothetical protein